MPKTSLELFSIASYYKNGSYEGGIVNFYLLLKKFYIYPFFLKLTKVLENANKRSKKWSKF